jgi:hypothetical protein
MLKTLGWDNKGQCQNNPKTNQTHTGKNCQIVIVHEKVILPKFETEPGL